MPPTPKKRLAKARTRSRKANWRLPALTLIPCPKCGNLRLAHHVCPICGTYRGMEVVEIEVKEAKKEKGKEAG
ncbi:MAG: 50S ribosomal protein L32 [Chloroflexi bacterium]|nr:50S ribosomal protein L32 [Chloroflexota bacterium]